MHMDRVRFGRALGVGARQAVRSLTEAVEAATAANPQARQAPMAERAQGLQKQARRAGGSVLKPLKKFSSVLWLEVTGTFFALIAAYLSQGLWAHRGDWKAGSGDMRTYALHLVAFVVFAYFAVSNFVRAWRRDRR
jgi:hypothetical protein